MRSSSQLSSLLLKMQSISFLTNTRASTCTWKGQLFQEHFLVCRYFKSSWESRTNHHGEDDGSLGGLDDPQQDQTAQLDDGEKMDLPQRDVTEIDEVGLVLSWHAEQREAVEELQKTKLCS